MNSECVVCGDVATEVHHVKTRGAGGGDEDWNLLPICRRCHVDIHKAGLYTFSRRHRRVFEWLIKKGWECINGKWVHSNKVQGG